MRIVTFDVGKVPAPIVREDTVTITESVIEEIQAEEGMSKRALRRAAKAAQKAAREEAIAAKKSAKVARKAAALATKQEAKLAKKEKTGKKGNKALKTVLVLSAVGAAAYFAWKKSQPQEDPWVAATNGADASAFPTTDTADNGTYVPARAVDLTEDSDHALGGMSEENTPKKP